MNLREALNEAINKVDKNMGLKEFPYITENRKWTYYKRGLFDWRLLGWLTLVFI